MCIVSTLRELCCDVHCYLMYSPSIQQPVNYTTDQCPVHPISETVSQLQRIQIICFLQDLNTCLLPIFSKTFPKKGRLTWLNREDDSSNRDIPSNESSNHNILAAGKKHRVQGSKWLRSQWRILFIRFLETWSPRKNLPELLTVYTRV